ncbi:MAG: hypothetical protein KKD28_04895, partial [Chloroflexi bacterium]|nr:hypothetical protein [Chloroflexota bacterium]
MAKLIQSLRNYMIKPRRVALGYALVAMAGLLMLRGWTDTWVQHHLQMLAQAQVSAQVNLLGDNL